MARLLIGGGQAHGIGGGHELASDEEIRLHNALGRLTVDLLKSVLQTSIYLADHPLAVQAVDAALESLDPLRGRFFELGYVASADANRPDFTIEGLFVEAVPLTSCLKGTLKDDFLGKLVDFFQRNKLVSLTLHRDLDRPQLEAFLDEVTGHARLADDGDGGLLAATRTLHRPGEGLAERLARREVLAISVLTRDDVLLAERHMPWRVKLALTRLRTDLSRLPLYAKASQQQLKQVKARLLEEIIRPLRASTMMMELVLNCDLARPDRDAAAWEDLEGEIIELLGPDQLRALAAELIGDIGRNPDSTDEEQSRRQRSLAALKHCLSGLADSLDEEALPLFQQAVDKGLVREDELPDKVRLQFRIEELTEEFLAEADTYLRQLREVGDAAAFRDRAMRTGLVARGLIGRSEHRTARRILETLQRHAAPGANAPELAQRAAKATLDGVLGPSTFKRMVSQLGTVSAKQRPHLMRLFSLLGRTAIPMALSALSEPLDEPTRARTREVLVAVGTEVIPDLRRTLSAGQQRAELYRDLVVVLGELGDAEGYAMVEGFVSSPEAQVRQAALTAMVQIGGSRAEDAAVGALDDQDLGVRSTALKRLGELGSGDLRFLRFLEGLLGGKMRLTVEGIVAALFRRHLRELRTDQLGLLTSGCAALGSLIERGLLSGATAESKLLRLLKRQLRAQLIAAGEGAVAQGRAELIDALIEVLGRMGTRAALPLLGRARDDGPKASRAAAAAAIHQIVERRGEGGRKGWFWRLLRRLGLSR